MTEDVFGPLLDELGPDLYRRNAFRVTGLGILASPREIRRHAEKMRVANRFGSDSTSESVLFGPDPDATEIQEAAQRLRDPARRLLDELFWFWPVQPGRPDLALTALRRGDLDEAERLWTESASSVGRHNLAVLAHARALDASGTASWPEVFMAWVKVVHDRNFWTLLESRARDFDDPRLGPATAARIRADLPEALLGINARLAVTALRDGRRPEAEAHIVHMERSGFARLDVAEALRRAVEPDASRLRTLGEHAENTADADPARGAESAERLLDQAGPLLDVLAIALPDDSPVLRGARDDVANRALGCVIPYANKTDDWPPAVRVLERALAVAATNAVRKRVSDSLDIAKSNLMYLTCWFCKEHPADKESAYEQKLSGNVQHHMGRVAWQVLTVNVPRCATCRSGHRKRQAALYASSAGAAVVGTALGLAAFSSGVVALGVVVLIVAGLAALVFLALGSEPLPESEKAKVHRFELIRERLEGDWFFGPRPPGVN
ncbi:hypothetical protein [Actinomadura terrae]|uniref:hypothetical protein n=1 Tax=Actinomadura terrae TaxID=604353 RepID=UPI001FA7695A|nr:hypothetical protein [Actinomadura terrae]